MDRREIRSNVTADMSKAGGVSDGNAEAGVYREFWLAVKSAEARTGDCWGQRYLGIASFLAFWDGF